MDPFISSIWGQLASFFFLMAGFFFDVLVIRGSLFLAYLFLLLNGLLGFPEWVMKMSPDYPASIGWDSVVWSILNLYVHGVWIVKFILDERPVELTEDEDALWRMFYRRSGLTRMVFQRHLLPHCTLRTFEPGETVPSKIDGERQLYVVLDGQMKARIQTNLREYPFTFYSGDVFDIKYLNLLGIHVGFMNSHIRECTAETYARAFTFPISTLTTISEGSPFARMAWQSVLISCIAKVIERPWSEEFSDEKSSVEQPKAKKRVKRFNRMPVAPGSRDPIFNELEESEMMPSQQPGSGYCWKYPCTNTFRTIFDAFLPPWPCTPWSYGLRHKQMAPPFKVASDLFVSATRMQGSKTDDEQDVQVV